MGTHVLVWMKWQPTPAAVGKLKTSSVRGATSSYAGAKPGEILPAATTFDVNEEAEVVFTRTPTGTGFPEFVAAINISGVAKSLTLPAVEFARPIQKLRVRVKTGTVEHSSTDGRIYLVVGEKKLRLDREGYNNFEAGKTDEFLFDAWNGLTDKAIMLMETKIVNQDYEKSGEGWYCSDLFFAYMVGGVWHEWHFQPGWLDEKHGKRTGTFRFVLTGLDK